jgi:phosphoribosylformylglycinamidine (FGAM) synthase-like amidotransferase family enzyme
MPRPKSVLKRLQVDTAQRSHYCQHVRSHRILQGQKRLKLIVNRNEEHFCIDCALQIIEADIKKLQDLKEQLTSK